MQKTGLFIFVFFAAAAAAIALKLGAGFLLMELAGNIKKDNAWIRELYCAKETIAEDPKFDERKIVLVSGSNGLFGIDATELEKQTSLPVQNWAMHGGYSFDYLMGKAESHIKKSDVVLLPLEFEYYYNRDSFYSHMASNVLLWDKPYFFSLGLFDKAVMLFTANRLFFSRSISAIINPKKYLLDSDQEIKRKFTQQEDPQKADKAQYSYRLLKKDGTYKVPRECDFSGDNAYFATLGNPDKDCIKNIASWKQRLEKLGAKVVLTYPAIMLNKDFNPDSEREIAALNRLKAALKEEGLKLEFDIHRSCFDRKYFSDSYYHLNEEGQLLRSRLLGEDLAKLLSEKKK